MCAYKQINLNFLDAFIDVKIKVDVFELRKDFKPARKITESRIIHCGGFPVYDNEKIKRDFVEEVLSKNWSYLEALYFNCKIFQHNTDNLLFAYEDYFVENPEDRVHIEWEWDKENHLAVGVTYYTDGNIGDPRKLPGWDKTLEEHRRQRDNKQ